jgi:hypothetical protein
MTGLDQTLHAESAYDHGLVGVGTVQSPTLAPDPRDAPGLNAKDRSPDA